jgi:dTDP-glucose pyrophosphorylase
MEYLIERMRRASCTELLVITRPEKHDVVEYARQQDARVILARPRSVSESLLAGLRDLDDSDVVLFGFPDNIWEPEEGFVKLVEALDESCRVALGLFRSETPKRCDVVSVSTRGTITGVYVKSEEPPSDLIWGCGVAYAGALRGLGEYDEPGHYFDQLARHEDVRGVWLSETCIDIGTKETLSELLGRATPEA